MTEVKLEKKIDDKLDHLVINVFALMFDSIYRDDVLNSFNDYQVTGRFAE